MSMVGTRRILLLACSLIAWTSPVTQGIDPPCSAAEVNGARSVETIEEIDRQLESNPLSEKYLILKAKILFEKEEYRSVIETLRPLLVKYPKSIDALEGTAKAYVKLEEYGRAIPFLNTLIELRPCFNYLYLRGLCRSRVGLHKEALEDNDRCISLSPQEADSFVQRAEIHRAQFGLDEQCEKLMRRAIELAPRDPVIKTEWEKFSKNFQEFRAKSSR